MYFGYLVNEKVYIENSMKNCKWEGNYFLLNRKNCRRAFFVAVVVGCTLWHVGSFPQLSVEPTPFCVEMVSLLTTGLLGKSPERALLKKNLLKYLHVH